MTVRFESLENTRHLANLPSFTMPEFVGAETHSWDRLARSCDKQLRVFSRSLTFSQRTHVFLSYVHRSSWLMCENEIMTTCTRTRVNCMTAYRRHEIFFASARARNFMTEQGTIAT